MRPQLVHPIQKLRQESMQPGGQDVVDVAVAQFGTQAAGVAHSGALGFGADQQQVVEHFAHAVVQ